MKRDWRILIYIAGLLGPAGCIPEGGGAVSGAAAENTAEGKKCPPDGVIDDCEDDNNQVAPNKGRSGYWYTFLDKVGSTVTPAAGGTFTMSRGGANGSAHSAHVNGKIGGGAVVFGGMGFNFVDPKGPYDASAYKGISFWARVGEGSTTKVRLKLPDADTDPDGKVCTECFNDFGMDLELTTTWTKYTVPFNGTTQMAGWGAPHPGALNPAKMFGVQWQINSPGSSYDLWVDDIQFTGCP
jgi:endoglucanase